MTYTAYIEAIINKQHEGAPIFVDRIAEDMADYYDIPKQKALAAASVAIKRLMDNRKLPDLRRYQKGIYYRTAVTAFGELGIDKTALIRNKYLIHDQGYITGYMFLYRLGLTTWIWRSLSTIESELSTTKSQMSATLDSCWSRVTFSLDILSLSHGFSM